MTDQPLENDTNTGRSQKGGASGPPEEAPEGASPGEGPERAALEAVEAPLEGVAPGSWPFPGARGPDRRAGSATGEALEDEAGEADSVGSPQKRHATAPGQGPEGGSDTIGASRGGGLEERADPGLEEVGEAQLEGGEALEGAAGGEEGVAAAGPVGGGGGPPAATHLPRKNPASPAPPGGEDCPHCGAWTSASDDGRLTCGKCRFEWLLIPATANRRCRAVTESGLQCKGGRWKRSVAGFCAIHDPGNSEAVLQGRKRGAAALKLALKARLDDPRSFDGGDRPLETPDDVVKLLADTARAVARGKLDLRHSAEIRNLAQLMLKAWGAADGQRRPGAPPVAKEGDEEAKARLEEIAGGGGA